VTSSADRKKYWDLLETLRWIEKRDEQMVAEIWEWSDDDRMALALFGMKVRRFFACLPKVPG
jgi:hypothetical protein